jgi:hypothetical protein
VRERSPRIDDAITGCVGTLRRQFPGGRMTHREDEEIVAAPEQDHGSEAIEASLVDDHGRYAACRASARLRARGWLDPAENGIHAATAAMRCLSRSTTIWAARSTGL